MKSRLLTYVLVTTLALGIAPALAANGKSNGARSSSIELVMPQGRSGGLVIGDSVTFTVSTQATAFPWVRARCFQNGGLVYEQWHGLFEGYYTEPIFTLGPTPKWSSGAAECVGDLVDNGRRDRVLASTAFHVGHVERHIQSGEGRGQPATDDEDRALRSSSWMRPVSGGQSLSS